ncbi:MAG: phenylalanine--tRNA ligase subunit alpha [Coriobacteriales bacterium]|nr:phenylalanine--tRNA ligase subunit alpha [Coriobacteriales bacterium]
MQTVDIPALQDAALSALAAASSSKELEQVRVAVLGKKGSLTQVLRGMGEVPKEQRASLGALVNVARETIEAALAGRAAELAEREMETALQSEAVDVTLPGRTRTIGSEHLISRLTREIVEVFRGIGYRVVEGPEVETEYYNFTALNAPPDHPSRGLQDTFYVRDRSGTASRVAGESEVLLRSQTSPVQVRIMEEEAPPIYILAPGRVYRRDVADPSHLPQFTQIEGLVVDEGISFAQLKGTLEYFCREVFGPERSTRFRPHFFPFTEPSAEVDVSCGICGGAGCRFCGHTGWLEILGCGMVDPNVFGFVNIDTTRYQGFAFGLGIERIACLKYDVPDLRMLLEGDMRFLRQF